MGTITPQQEKQVFETLALCEASGINTAILRLDDDTLRILKAYWKERGGKIQWIAQIAIQESAMTDQIKQAIDAPSLHSPRYEADGSSRRRAEQEAAERILNDPAVQGRR